MRPLKKIVLRLEPNAWHGYETETVWAEDLGRGSYRLRNVPFFARGISAEDVVEVEDGSVGPTVKRVTIRGGHSTYRVFLREGVKVDDPEYISHWGPLAVLGCTYERATDRLVAFDIPAAADIHAVFGALENGAKKGVWDFEEGHCALNN